MYVLAINGDCICLRMRINSYYYIRTTILPSTYNTTIELYIDNYIHTYKYWCKKIIYHIDYTKLP